MHIGIDFDNTIVSYDNLFYVLGCEHKLIPEYTLKKKIAVRDYLRKINREDAWIEMQGEVYGSRMMGAEMYSGLFEFLIKANSEDHKLSIVSHKTLHPFSGPKYNLHKSAKSWIDEHLLHNGSPLIKNENIYFELTKPEKINRINSIQCDVFIDDLPEILMAPSLGPNLCKVLFDPYDDHLSTAGNKVFRIKSWNEADRFFNAK